MSRWKARLLQASTRSAAMQAHAVRSPRCAGKSGRHEHLLSLFFHIGTDCPPLKFFQVTHGLQRTERRILSHGKELSKTGTRFTRADMCSDSTSTHSLLRQRRRWRIQMEPRNLICSQDTHGRSATNSSTIPLSVITAAYQRRANLDKFPRIPLCVVTKHASVPR